MRIELKLRDASYAIQTDTTTNIKALQVLNTLCHSKPETMVFRCSRADSACCCCLKLIRSREQFDTERRNWRMLQQHQVSHLFAELYFFGRVSLRTGQGGALQQWYCIGMELIHIPVYLVVSGDIILRPNKAPERHRRGVWLEGAARVNKETQGGIIIKACLQLIKTLAAKGVVHGDTHMGNFLYCPDRNAVFAIDIERCFKSAEPLQHLLDAQELYGHYLGILTKIKDKSAWDFSLLVSMALEAHPLLTKRRARLDNLIPLCSCFALEGSRRLKGCCLCRSTVVQQAAQWFQKLDIEKHSEIPQRGRALAMRREEARATCTSIGDTLLRHADHMQPIFEETGTTRVALAQNSELRVEFAGALLYASLITPRLQKTASRVYHLFQKANMPQEAAAFAQACKCALDEEEPPPARKRQRTTTTTTTNSAASACTLSAEPHMYSPSSGQSLCATPAAEGAECPGLP